jgi:thioesterase domain-containing protein
MVAFEAARGLMAAGHKVHMVAMVDPPTISARPAPRALLGRMKALVSPYHLRWTYELMTRLERFFSASPRKQIAKLSKALSNPYFNNEIPPALWDAYSIAMAEYLPAPLDVPVTFYAAEHDGRAWQHLSSRLEVIHVPGGHGDCLNIGAELLVDHLQQRIDVLHGGASPSLNRTRRTPEATVA